MKVHILGVYGELVLRSATIGLAASFGIGDVFFMQNSEFAAEWWCVLELCMGMQSVLVMMNRKNLFGRCIRNPLAAWNAYASEFTLFLVPNCFFCQTAFCNFLRAA